MVSKGYAFYYAQRYLLEGTEPNIINRYQRPVDY